MNKELSKEARELKNKYHRQWQRANKEKVKQYNIKHWEKKVGELKGNSEE